MFLKLFKKVLAYFGYGIIAVEDAATVDAVFEENSLLKELNENLKEQIEIYKRITEATKALIDKY